MDALLMHYVRNEATSFSVVLLALFFILLGFTIAVTIRWVMTGALAVSVGIFLFVTLIHYQRINIGSLVYPEELQQNVNYEVANPRPYVVFARPTDNPKHVFTMPWVDAYGKPELRLPFTIDTDGYLIVARPVIDSTKTRTHKPVQPTNKKPETEPVKKEATRKPPRFAKDFRKNN